MKKKSFNTIEIEQRKDRIAILRMTRASELNTLSYEFMNEMYEALIHLKFDDQVRVIIITGMGKAFCAGAELKLVKNFDALSSRNYLRQVADLFTCIEELEKPVIAAINGFALGGGFEMAIACDFRIMAEETKVGLPEIHLGTLPNAGGLQRLPKLVGRGKANEIVMLGRHYTAKEALEMGLIYRYAPGSDLMNTALELAQELAQKSLIALRFGKTSLNVAADLDTKNAIRYGLEAICMTFAAEDQKEGMKAFLEKRKPNFKDR